MALRLYADECVDARIIAGLPLRHRGIETTAAEQDLLGANDDTHLERATTLGMVLVTADTYLLGLIHERCASHPGLLFILPKTTIGNAIRSIVLAAHVLNHDDIKDEVEWIA